MLYILIKSFKINFGLIDLNKINKCLFLYEFQVPFKGNSKSAKGVRVVQITEKQQRVQSERVTRRRWSPPPGVNVDNYSFV